MEVVISYETIFDMVRKEKNRAELQTLPPGFIVNVCDYLQAKRTLLHKGFDSSSPFEEKQRLILHIQNMKKLLKELYERRETKLLHLAQNKVRTGNVFVDNAALLTEEKELLEELTGLLDSKRSMVLKKMTQSAADRQLFDTQVFERQDTAQVEPPKEEKKEPEKTYLTLRFLKDVPKFVGRDLEIYGPYTPGDIAAIPRELANILLEKNRVEEIRAN